ncbi:Protein FAR1-RELATED SEQUENCE 11 [Glycine soja]
MERWRKEEEVMKEGGLGGVGVEQGGEEVRVEREEKCMEASRARGAKKENGILSVKVKRSDHVFKCSKSENEKNPSGVYKREFVCHRAGNAKQHKVIELERKRKQKSLKCNCSAKMWIAKRKIVSCFNNSHNHELLDDKEVQYLPAYHDIPADDHNRILLLSKVCCLVSLIIKVLELEKGIDADNLSFLEKDIKNFIQSQHSIEEENEGTEVLKLCKSLKDKDDAFQYDFTLDENNKLEHIIWVFGDSIRAYEAFGDAVIFDTTYGINRYDMPHGLWIGVDNCYALCYSTSVPSLQVIYKMCFKGYLDVSTSEGSLSEIGSLSESKVLCLLLKENVFKQFLQMKILHLKKPFQRSFQTQNMHFAYGILWQNYQLGSLFLWLILKTMGSNDCTVWSNYGWTYRLVLFSSSILGFYLFEILFSIGDNNLELVLMSLLEIKLEKRHECGKSTIILQLEQVFLLRNMLQLYLHLMPLSCYNMKLSYLQNMQQLKLVMTLTQHDIIPKLMEAFRKLDRRRRINLIYDIRVLLKNDHFHLQTKYLPLQWRQKKVKCLKTKDRVEVVVKELKRIIELVKGMPEVQEDSIELEHFAPNDNECDVKNFMISKTKGCPRGSRPKGGVEVAKNSGRCHIPNYDGTNHDSQNCPNKKKNVENLSSQSSTKIAKGWKSSLKEDVHQSMDELKEYFSLFCD